MAGERGCDALRAVADRLNALTCVSDTGEAVSIAANFAVEGQQLANALVLLQHQATHLQPLRHIAVALEPGTPVELFGLTKMELNGCRACIGAGGWTGERYNVDVWRPGASRTSRMLIKPANLWPSRPEQTPAALSSAPTASAKPPVSRRAEAAHALCRWLHTCPGFVMHPSLWLEEDDFGEVCVRTRGVVRQGELLLVVPHSANVLAAAELAAHAEAGELRELLPVFTPRWRAWAAAEGRVLANLDAELVLLTMALLSGMRVRAGWELVAATWPSAAQLAHVPLLWSDAEVAALRSTAAGRRIELLRCEASGLFTCVVEPLLRAHASHGRFCARGATLRATFLHAAALVLSRCVDASYGFSAAELGASTEGYSTRAVFIALIDLINGLPEGEESIGCNVELSRGRPFAFAPALAPRCPWDDASCRGLECGVIEATRELAVGEELLMSYGEMSTAEFVVKFGHVPDALMHATVAPDAIGLQMPPADMPHASDELRWRALRALGYEGPGREGDAAEMATFELSCADLHAYTSSGAGGGSRIAGNDNGRDSAAVASRASEPTSVAQLSLFVLLLHAPTTALEALLERGALPAHAVDSSTLGRALVALVEANMGALEAVSAADTDAADARAATSQAATSPQAPARAPRPPPSRALGQADILRRKERSLLELWRDAFRKRFGLPPPGHTLHACWTQTQLRAARLPMANRLPEPSPPASVAARASRVLGGGRRQSPASWVALRGRSEEPSCSAAMRTPLASLVHVEAAWLSRAALCFVREAADALVRARCERAGVGPTQAVDESVRACDAVDLLAPVANDTTPCPLHDRDPNGSRWSALPLPPPLLDLTRAIDRLRVELSAATGRALVDAIELQLLRYPPGGHYRRHVDTSKTPSGRATGQGNAEGGMRLRRSVSLLVYLTDDTWDVARDGGELRIFDTAAAGDDGPALADVAPAPGTLVLFDSATVPHGVLPTRRERLALVGWLCEAD